MPRPNPDAALATQRPLLLDPRCSALPPSRIATLLEDPAQRFAAYAGQAGPLGGQVVVWGARDDGKLFNFDQGIAVIQARGPLFNDGFIDLWWGWSGYKGLALQHEAAIADPEVRAVLWDISSPGGVGNGCFDLVDQIHASRGDKPIWAYANDTATSAAYAIASAADRVLLPRFGSVGSIGVWCAHVDFSEMLKEAGIAVTLIFSGSHKVDGNPFEPLPDPVRADIQADIDRMRQVFAETVARNRSIDVASVLATEAAVFDDSDAEQAGLADAVATEDEVLDALLTLIGNPASSAAAA